VPVPTDLRLSLLELTHVLDRLLRLYRSRPWRELEPVYEPELSRLSTVADLTLAQVRGLLDQGEGAAFEYELKPPFHAPPRDSLLYRVNLRRRHLERRPNDSPSRPRPNA
jgi:hypothetical protein